MILEVADNVDADLIILGTNERPFIEHALGMSVSGSVSRKAHRDVLIVH
jgi:nucleotide-binding universal stress UspA family protein